jgi:hypothetical protein
MIGTIMAEQAAEKGLANPLRSFANLLTAAFGMRNKHESFRYTI